MKFQEEEFLKDAREFIRNIKEDEFIEECLAYIKETYGEHYNTQKGNQTIEYIQALDSSNSLIYPKGNVIKYASRFGRKDGFNKKDLFKAMHYICFMNYYAYNKNNKENMSSEDQ